MFPCPCCGHIVFLEPPGSFDICPICFWEDDVVQLVFPDLAGGANKVSLIDAQSRFAAIGACEERFRTHVRAPLGTEARDPVWRPLDREYDRFLKWERREDHALWQTIKTQEHSCLYYWSPAYWLLDRDASEETRGLG